MSFGSLFRIGLEVTLVGMLLAAVRRNTGYIFAYEKYGIAKYIYNFLSYGDYCYRMFSDYCRTSSYFRKVSKDLD
ncbi:Mco12p PWA37_003870 [Arxiozyma heterogenica]|uniref:Mco12p n=1 Tax=Arxiozyma heterogenica TaxID=278026 RepID=UPI002EE8A129